MSLDLLQSQTHADLRQRRAAGAQWQRSGRMGCCTSKKPLDPAPIPGRPAVRPSQLSHPTIDPTTGLPFAKKKGNNKKKLDEPKPNMAKQCANCLVQGTLFGKESFNYCSMGCLTKHKGSAEFAARYAENEKLRSV